MRANKYYDFFLKFYRTVKHNVFYILLSLAVPLILWKVQVGRDIVVSLTEQGSDNYLNIPLLIAAFSLLALSNWVIPVLAIDLWALVMRRPVRSQPLFGGLIALYNGDTVTGRVQFPIRYFASLPWVIFLYVTVLSFFPSQPVIAIITIAALILCVVLIDWAYRRKRVPRVFQGLWDNVAETKAGNRVKALRYVLVMSLVFTLFLILVGSLAFWLRTNRTGLTVLVVGANFIGLLANYAYMKFAENVDVRVVAISYFVSKYTHILSLAFMVLVAVLLQSSNGWGWPVEIGSLSPIFVLIAAISLYLFLADVLVTAQLNITAIYNGDPGKYGQEQQGKAPKAAWVWYRPLVRTVALVAIFLFLFNSINSHRIRRVAAQPGHSHPATMRLSLTAYFDEWVASRTPNRGDTLDVYLVSGQGGGSRAAVWFFMAMNYLDSLQSTPSSRFSDRVFSISTVSGSTSGAAMFLADRYLQVPQHAASVVPRMKAIYGKNYLSSSFWGVLIGDSFEGAKHEVFNRLTGKQGASPKDRNYYFQEEEVSGYTNATPSITPNEINHFFKADYLTHYVAPAALYPGLPLFFINSAIVETGERGVFSPVSLSGFSLATDLYGLFKQHHPQYSIPLITCVNQSQAFPVINAYNYLDGAGRLIDGGIYENSGTTTTLEVYETLRRHLATRQDTSHIIRLVCINIVNTNMDTAKDTVRFRPASVLNTLTAAFQSPFGGHEQFSYRNIMRRVSAPDTVFSFTLDRPVPLTRMLQPSAIDTMYTALRAMGTDVSQSIDNAH